MASQLPIFSSPDHSESPDQIQEEITNFRQTEAYQTLAAHPVFDLGYALFKGDSESRMRKLLILNRIIDEVGTSVANDGTIREMTLPEIQYLAPEIPSDEAADLVHRMSQDGLLTCQGKNYQVAPLAAVLLQFIHFVTRMQDETGSSTAVISSVFGYQLEIGSQNGDRSNHVENHEAIKAIIRDIGRFNAHLENTIRHSVLADLDGIVKDLNAVNYFCQILDGLVGKMSTEAQQGDVYWLERARRVIHRLRDLIDALQGAYSIRISKSLAGSGRYVTDEVLEKWLVHALANEKEQIVAWIGEFDRPAYISVFPTWLLVEIAESGPPNQIVGDDPDKIKLTSSITTETRDHFGSDEERQITGIIQKLIQGMVSRKGESMLVSSMVEEKDWETTAIRLCYLGTVIELLERDHLEKWAVDPLPEIIRFDPGSQVASLSEAEIGEWTYLTQKKTERGEL